MTQGSIAHARDGAVLVVELRGEHDVGTASAVRGEVHGPLERSEPVVVDLRRATFIDSSILAVLLSALRRAREREAGFGLVLESADETPVRRTFDVTGLIPVFPIFASRDAAVAAVGEGRNT